MSIGIEAGCTEVIRPDAVNHWGEFGPNYTRQDGSQSRSNTSSEFGESDQVFDGIL